jgi:DNA invertase Pin-like site-specific DNA recombinase
MTAKSTDKARNDPTRGATAVYIRTSSQMQEDGHGADAQEHVIKQWLSAYKAGETYDEFRDLARSGKNTNRPSFNEMLAEIRKGKYKLVVTHDLSRIGRSLPDLLTFMEEMQDRGVRVVFIKDNIDVDTTVGRLMLGIMGAVAQFERERLSERTAAGIAAAREEDPRWGMGRVPKHERPRPPHARVSDEQIRRLRDQITGLSREERAEQLRDKAHRWGVQPDSLRRRLMRLGFRFK